MTRSEQRWVTLVNAGKLKTNRNILITGGCGHIGSAMISHDCMRDYNITVVDNMLTQRYCSLFNLPNYSSYNFLHLDLTKCTINDIPKTDFVIHLAAKTDAAQSAKFKYEFYTTYFCKSN